MTSLTEENSSTESKETTRHIPVMVPELVANLNLKPGMTVVDCTLGLGGHAQVLLEKIVPQGRLIGIDRDLESLKVARERLTSFQDQALFLHADFRQIEAIFKEHHLHEVDAILFDLGLSSYQLERPERGFSFQTDGPLDMRMDQESFISAYDLVNSLSEMEIAKILKKYGEERLYRRIARVIVEERAHRPIATTQELRDLVVRAYPARLRRQRIHPATRSFQAFRIAVNRELEALETTLSQCPDLLKSGGRIAVIAFHSLEDRVVKRAMQQAVREGRLRLILKKPLTPTEEEIRENPRARSARLRVGEKI